jgi:hypothetical protein
MMCPWKFERFPTLSFLAHQGVCFSFNFNYWLSQCRDIETSVVLVYKVQPGYIYSALISWVLLVWKNILVRYDLRQYPPYTSKTLNPKPWNPVLFRTCDIPSLYLPIQVPIQGFMPATYKAKIRFGPTYYQQQTGMAVLKSTQYQYPSGMKGETKRPPIPWPVSYVQKYIPLQHWSRLQTKRQELSIRVEHAGGGDALALPIHVVKVKLLFQIVA